MENSENSTVKRGGCLTAFLVAMFILNPLTSIYYFTSYETVLDVNPSMTKIKIMILAIMGFVNLGCAIAAWNWKKIGIYGFWISAVIILGINLSSGVNPALSLVGFLGPIIITLLVRPKWSQFE